MKVPLYPRKWPVRVLVFCFMVAFSILANSIMAIEATAVSQEKQRAATYHLPTIGIVRTPTGLTLITMDPCSRDILCAVKTSDAMTNNALSTSIAETSNAVNTAIAATSTSMVATFNAGLTLTALAIPTDTATPTPSETAAPADTPVITPSPTPWTEMFGGPTVVVSIVGCIGAIAVAVISGWFTLKSKGGKKE